MKFFLFFLFTFYSFFGFSGIEQQFEFNLGDELSMITWADIDGQGNVYLLDGKSSVLIKIDNKGKIILKKQRKGEGPGEFQYPSSIKYVNNVGIFVSDILRRKMTLLDENFKFKNVFNLPVFPFAFSFTSKNLFVMSDSLKGNDYSLVVYKIPNKKNPNIETIFEGNKMNFGQQNSKINLDNSIDIFFDANNQYSVFIKSISEKLEIYFQNNNKKFTTLNKIRLNFDKIPLCKEEKEEAIEEAYKVAKRVNPNVSEKNFIATNKIACNYLTIDEDNNIWLLVSTVKKDVFKLICFYLPEKKIVETFFIDKFRKPGIEVNNNHILIFEKSVLSDPKIVEYINKF